jgi:phosphoribosyl 1,2-cyclic phosphate phosphodiesterase
MRTSILLETNKCHLLIDTTPDLRTQLIGVDAPRIDAVIWTHGHYDHYAGYGEFYRVQQPPPVYASPEVLSYCSQFFNFLTFKQHPIEPFTPFELFGAQITLFPVNHPSTPTFGIRIKTDNLAIGYTSDTRIDIPEKSRNLLYDVDLLIVDAIVPPDLHLHKHMNYREATQLATELNVGDFRCVHLSHMIPWNLANIGKDFETFDW